MKELITFIQRALPLKAEGVNIFLGAETPREIWAEVDNITKPFTESEQDLQAKDCQKKVKDFSELYLVLSHPKKNEENLPLQNSSLLGY